MTAQNVFMDQFNLEARTQRVWDLNHAVWFTLMGLGGGVFLAGRILNLTEGLGYLLGIPTVDIVSFVAIAVGGAILVADLGRPLQFWRAFVNVRTSWISWGAGLGVAVLFHLLTRTDAPGKKESLDRLLRGQYRRTFLGAVFVGGAVAPVVLGFAGAAVASPRDALAVICCVLLVVGGFLLRLVTLRVGIFPPVHIPSLRTPGPAASIGG